jgi:hypothetical protein
MGLLRRPAAPAALALLTFAGHYGVPLAVTAQEAVVPRAVETVTVAVPSATRVTVNVTSPLALVSPSPATVQTPSSELSAVKATPSAAAPFWVTIAVIVASAESNVKVASTVRLKPTP